MSNLSRYTSVLLTWISHSRECIFSCSKNWFHIEVSHLEKNFAKKENSFWINQVLFSFCFFRCVLLAWWWDATRRRSCAIWWKFPGEMCQNSPVTAAWKLKVWRQETAKPTRQPIRVSRLLLSEIYSSVTIAAEETREREPLSSGYCTYYSSPD